MKTTVSTAPSGFGQVAAVWMAMAVSRRVTNAVMPLRMVRATRAYRAGAAGGLVRRRAIDALLSRSLGRRIRGGPPLSPDGRQAERTLMSVQRARDYRA